MSNLVPFLPLVGIALLFWLLFVRPAQRRQRAMEEHAARPDRRRRGHADLGHLRHGAALHEETVLLEVADGVTLRVVRAAVGERGDPGGRSRDDDTELARPTVEPEEKQ